MKVRNLLVTDIKGVGDKTAEALHRAGLNTALDLVNFLPRTYDDYSTLTSIAALQPGNVVVKGKISNISDRRVRRGLTITQATLSDSTASVALVWFNQPYRSKQLKSNKEWLVAGEFGLSGNKYQIMNPSVRADDEVVEDGNKIVPIYRQVSGLKTAQLQKIIEEIRPLITMFPELLPQELVNKFQLLNYADALVAVHFPDSPKQLAAGRQRLAFQEVIELLTAAELNKKDNQALPAWPIKFNLTAAKQFLSQLPFELTDWQRKAAWEILQDMEKNTPMNRLLQGDVGAGKTIVAGMAAAIAAHDGFQSAVMAPTELLATQHAETLSKVLAPLGVTVGLLTGSIKKSAKDSLLQSIADGSTAIVVGTHALIQGSVEFHRLGLVVIDEQHRFGVNQRQKLLQKADKMPHLLSMTATPIPRSLQLTVYGELEVSLLKQRPKGRKSIITEVYSPVSRNRLYKEIDQQIEQGRQVYVVCPLINDSIDSERKSVEAMMDILKKTAFNHRRIGMLHGKLKADDKQSVMEKFAKGELDILVSTTVIEVGVDVPNATVMIIEGADRFGLAQLHQLRGRVGRSFYQSYCYLIPTDTKTPNQRLRELERSNDGFYLAERDLELRGPGEIYGHAQHGALNLQVANLADMDLLSTAKKAIHYAAEHSIDLLQYDEMRQRVEKYRRLTSLN